MTACSFLNGSANILKRTNFHAEGRVFYNDYGEAFDGYNELGAITRGQARQFFEDLLRRKTKDLFQINQEDRNRGLDATIG